MTPSRARLRALAVALSIGGCATAAPAPPPRAPSAPPSSIPSEKVDQYKRLIDAAAAAQGSGDTAGALRLLDQAKQLLPAEAPAYFGAGVTLYEAGRASAAAPEFKRAVELAPGPLKASIVGAVGETTTHPRSAEESELLHAAFEATEAGHPDRALAALQRALDLNPLNERTRYEIGYAMISLGRVEEAIPQLEEGRRINPVDGKLLGELQYCYVQLKRLVELRGVVSDRMLVEGEGPELLQEMGYAAGAAGDVDLGISTLEENVRRYPAFYPSHYSLGQLYCGKRRDAARGKAHLTAFVAAARAEQAHPPASGKPLLKEPERVEMVRQAEALATTCGR